MTCSKKGCDKEVTKPGYCTSCKKEYAAEYYKTNREAILEQKKHYYWYNLKKHDK